MAADVKTEGGGTEAVGLRFLKAPRQTFAAHLFPPENLVRRFGSLHGCQRTSVFRVGKGEIFGFSSRPPNGSGKNHRYQECSPDFLPLSSGYRPSSKASMSPTDSEAVRGEAHRLHVTQNFTALYLRT